MKKARRAAKRCVMAAALLSGVAFAFGIGLPASADTGATDWSDRAVRQRAVVETAYAFYLKGDCVQYDSVPLVVRSGTRFCRRTREGKPEDATPDSTYFTVCSSFTYETYFNAIGYRHSVNADTSVTILLTTRPQEAVVFEYDKRLDKDGAKYEPEMMRMRALLEVGDIIVYSTIKGKDPKTGETLGGGHALLYIGDEFGDGHPLVMHSGGAKYDFGTGVDQVEKCGTVRIDEMDSIFFRNGGLARQTKVMVFRPLDLPAERYPLTESAKSRCLHPRLRIDRRVDVGPYGSVVSGGELEYSLWLKNYSKTAYAVPVVEKVPAGCEKVDEAPLAWDVKLGPGEERTLRWRVKVAAPAGSRVVSSGGSVAGILSNTLVTEVVARRVSAAAARAWAKATVANATNLPPCRVEGWAGGRLSFDPPRGIRNRDPHARQLMVGDVVVVCPNLDRPGNFRLWVKGRGGLEEETPHGIRRVTGAEVTALLAKPFFAALRPAALAHGVDAFEARQKSVVSTALGYHEKGRLVQDLAPLSFVNDVCMQSVGVSLCDDPSKTTVSNLVVAPPAGMVVFEYDLAKDPELKRYDERMAWMWSIVEPGDIVAFMTDHPDKKGKPGKENAFVYIGDERGDGHPLYLYVVVNDANPGSELVRACGAVAKRNFSTLLHGRSLHHLRERSKIVVLRPYATSK
ncbi:MAG: hypothetical protein IKE55_08895 [Kiritimatiellae bacterium]|nr:hypothetical protein [Kiritimatiellia bacterium]